MNVADMKPRELSRLPIEDLAALDAEAARQLAHAKALRGAVDAALELKYAATARRQLFIRSQTSGTVHVDDGDFDVTVTFPKKVDWEPGAFRKALEKLQRKFADWHRFIVVEHALPEVNWSAMPEDLQKLFADARKEGVGKLRFRLTRKAKPELTKAA